MARSSASAHAKPPARRHGAAPPPKGRAPAKRSSKPSPPGPRSRARAAAAPPRRPKRRSFLWRWRRLLFLIGLLLVAGIAGTGFVLAQIDLPPARVQPLTSFICTSEVAVGDCDASTATAELFGEQNRVDVRLEQVPQVLISAVLAAEDRDFFRHAGVDPVGIARAAWQDIRGGTVSQGGSTITQQYVKLVYLSTERTFVRKIKEAVLAVKLEQELSKEEILERYLNTIYFGRGAYGVGTAARAYFGKDVGELSLADAAYLAGLIRAPEAADATRDPEEASRRRRTVLDAMLAEHMIDRDQRDAAAAQPWVLDQTIEPREQRQGLGHVKGEQYGTEYFIEAVRLQLLDYGFTDAEIYGGGLRVYTTLDHEAQRAAYETVVDTLDRDDDPLASIVAVDGDGMVRAMMAGRDFQESQVNLVTFRGQIGRQPGSSMKPFVLAAALEDGISLSSRFNAAGSIDIPRANGGRTWHVRNYGGTEQGVLSLLDATRVSSNTAYAQLMLEVGPDDVVRLAHDMGIRRELPAVNSLVLGTGEVSPLEMASAYSTFANDGLHVDPLLVTRVERPNGTVFTPPQDRAQVLDANVNAQVVLAMRGVVDRGTGTAARLSVPAAGKTGTTQDNNDAWFVGYLPNGMTAAVWMGYDPVDTDGDGDPDQPRHMTSVHGRSVTGGSLPAEMWHDFMRRWLDETGADVGRFRSVDRFPGRILGSDLSITTSTLPACGEEVGSSTTEACQATSTSSSSTSSSTTATSEPGSSTTGTTAPPASSTTATTADGPGPTTSTTAGEDG